MARRLGTIEQPLLRALGASGHWCLAQEWELPLFGSLLVLPAGVVTDLASVPAALHWLIDEDELGPAAALVHDVLYQHGGHLPVEWITPYQTYTRREADELLYLLALMSGAPQWRAWLAYQGVRAFARWCWKG